MKKSLFNLLFLALLLPMAGRAQGGVVSAPVLESIETANKATLIKQLAEAIKQTGTLGETYKVLKKSVELYYEVSEVFKGIEAVENAINKQIDLVNTCSRALADIRKVKGASAESVTEVRRNINIILGAYRENIEMVKRILSGELKMDDFGRTQTLLNIENKTAQAMRDVNSYKSAFEAGTAAKQALRNY